MKKLLILCVIAVFANPLLAQGPEILVPYRLGNKWGFSDTLGKIKLQPKYEKVTEFDYYYPENNHVIAIARLNGKELVINEQGKIIVPPVYEEVVIDDQAYSTIFIVTKNNKKTVFKNGKEILPVIFDSIEVASDDKFLVRIKDKWGLYSTSGKQLIPVVYDEINFTESITDSWEAIKDGKTKSYSFKPGKVDSDVMPPIEDQQIGSVNVEGVKFDENDFALKHGLDSVKMFYTSGVVYKKNNQGIFFEDNPDKLYFFSKSYELKNILFTDNYNLGQYYPGSKGLIIASLNGKYGIINQEGKEILPFDYDEISHKGNFCILTKNGKVGFFIIYTHYPVIIPRFDSYENHSLIPVNSNWSFTLFNIIKNGKEGYVGENGIEFFKD